MAFTPTQIQANIAALRSTYLLLSQQGSPQTYPQATWDIYNILDNVYSLATLDSDGSFATITVSGISTLNSISEYTVGGGITLSNNVIQKRSLTALNVTGTITAAMVNKGGITSTSAAPVTATLDTALAIGTQIGAVQGTSIDFIVDNTAGASTVTVAVAAGITAVTPVITGGATLTVSTANGIGLFRLVFSSPSAAKLYRIG